MYVFKSLLCDLWKKFSEGKRVKETFLFLLFIFIAFSEMEGRENHFLPASFQKDSICSYLTGTARRFVYVDSVRIDSLKADSGIVRIFTNLSLSYIPYDLSLKNEIYSHIRSFLPYEFRGYKVELYSDGYKIEDYIPFLRKFRFASNVRSPLLLKNLSCPYSVRKGLKGRYIALWQSHGWYYNQQKARWEWQRGRLMQTVEDLYTQSYVLPYLVPMLENAGATVFLPRERDIQRNEVIVDNDRSSASSEYRERNGAERWSQGEEPGFANSKPYYLDGENPFLMGTYRQVRTVKRKKPSSCVWLPDIPVRGRYAVYVSYKTLRKSTEDAHYSVYHLGGKTDFSLNQKMGGGTWIFLGFFSFDKGKNPNCKIVLTNASRKRGAILTSDGIKIGGGMGNMARLPYRSDTSDTLIKYEPQVSGRPRYTEGARYWLHWAGIPASIYNTRRSRDDYTDDYHCRGLWVNFLAGGSDVLPGKEGLNIPIDLSLAFHSDAGMTYNDSIIGTLGICMTHFENEKFANGQPRIISRDLTTSVMNEIIKDVRAIYAPEWTRRPIWNRSYSEARVPEVPAMLLEVLSHETFADMRYGLDPRFRFTVSRAVYKGILKFLAYQYKQDYVVQPLPVKNFSAILKGKSSVRLSWKPVRDKLEPTAEPDSYIIYSRMGEGAFDNGVKVSHDYADLTIKKDKVYSFKISAVNKGGESFPSEILSVCLKSNEKGRVIVVNGFDRLSAPYSFQTKDSLAGFLDLVDHGVPDKVQYNYVGSQYEFRRNVPWTDNDSPGYGASRSNYETCLVAGNTFDYPYLHGVSIARAGYSFSSAGRDAACDSSLDLSSYRLMDLILGKEKQTPIGNGKLPLEFKTFPYPLQKRIESFCRQGGSVFASGAYIGSDLWKSSRLDKKDPYFAEKILHYRFRTVQASSVGEVEVVPSPFRQFSGEYQFYQVPNPLCYSVESPDGIEPFGNNSYTVFRYGDSNIGAGIVSEGSYRTCILGFPFETVKNQLSRDQLMKEILEFISGEKKK